MATRLEFSYKMNIVFSAPVSRHCFSLRCLPMCTGSQTAESLNIHISPNHLLTETVDGFGNRVLTDRITAPHNAFSAEVSGIVRVDFSKREKEPLSAMYKYSSAYTRFTEELQAVYEALTAGTDITDPVRTAMLVSERLRGIFRYRSGATNVNTTAGEALKIGCGVCRDYAHILISVCRHAGIPARYVAGLQCGEGESHAWVEVYKDGIWYGVDPTNNRIVDERYIILSHGRDFGDCGINRGLLIGGGEQLQTVYTRVTVL